MISKTLIIGRHNPLSIHPSDALVPYPPGCSGHRLFKLLQIVRPDLDEDDYLDAFDRRNLWRQRTWPEGRGASSALRAEGAIILDACASRRNVVLLGVKVWTSVLDGGTPAYFHSKRIGMTRFWYMPHPSGRNVLYNNERNRLLAARVLEQLLPAKLEKEPT